MLAQEIHVRHLQRILRLSGLRTAGEIRDAAEVLVAYSWLFRQSWARGLGRDLGMLTGSILASTRAGRACRTVMSRSVHSVTGAFDRPPTRQQLYASVESALALAAACRKREAGSVRRRRKPTRPRSALPSSNSELGSGTLAGVALLIPALTRTVN
jgi:hypothetical protein